MFGRAASGSTPPPSPPQNIYHPMTHIFPAIVPPSDIPAYFAPLHTWFDATRLPPLPRILDPGLNAAARSSVFSQAQFPGIMELALLGDTVLKTIIIERLQELARCGRASFVADLSSRLDQNITFCYLCMAYDMIDIRGGPPPAQKCYADVFEAYIGALWRESNDGGKAHVRQVVRNIFSPAVFPVIAQWEAGRREFGAAPGLNKLARLKPKLRGRGGPSKALAIGVRPRHGDRRARSRGPSVPPQPQPAYHTPGRHHQQPRRAATAERPVIDLTLDDENSDDDSDSDSVIYLSESEWRQINAEAGPSRRPRSVISDVDIISSDADDDIPAVFIDTEPSPLPGHITKREALDPPPANFKSPPLPSPPATDGGIPSSRLPSPSPMPCPEVAKSPPVPQRHMQTTRAQIWANNTHPPASIQITSSWANDPRSVPDWLATMTPPASAVPAQLGLPTEERSPLRKLGDALGTVKDQVQAAFKRRAVKEAKRGA